MGKMGCKISGFPRQTRSQLGGGDVDDADLDLSLSLVSPGISIDVRLDAKSACDGRLLARNIGGRGGVGFGEEQFTVVLRMPYTAGTIGALAGITEIMTFKCGALGSGSQKESIPSTLSGRILQVSTRSRYLRMEFPGLPLGSGGTRLTERIVIGGGGGSIGSGGGLEVLCPRSDSTPPSSLPKSKSI
jgi:hypothetical protein